MSPLTRIKAANFVIYFLNVAHELDEPRTVPIAYLLGSIPSAYLVAKCNGKIDIRDESDGHISAAAVYRRVGLLSFILVVIMDIGKAALAVLVAQWMGAAPAFVMLAGICAVIAHQWFLFPSSRA